MFITIYKSTLKGLVLGKALLFFLRPSCYFRQINSERQGLYVYTVFVAYLITCYLWYIEVGSVAKEYSHVRILENITLNAIVFILFNVIAGAVLIISIFLFVINSQSRQSFISFVIASISLAIIPTISMIMQFFLLIVLDEMRFNNLLDWISFIVFMVYLHICIVNVASISKKKAWFVQFGGIGIVICFAVIAFFCQLGWSERDSKCEGIELKKHYIKDADVNKYYRAMKENPTDPKNHFYLAEAYRYQLQSDPELLSIENSVVRSEIANKIEMEYKKAIMLDSSFIEARAGLGLLYSKLHRYQEAIVQLDSVLSRCPKNKFVNRTIGSAYLHLGDTEKAKEHFKHALGDQLNRSFSENVYRASEKNIYNLRDNQKITLMSEISWSIDEPILYFGSMGKDIDRANSILSDTYYIISSIIIGVYSHDEVIQGLNSGLERELIVGCNESKLRDRYGIKVTGLKLKMDPKGSYLNY